MGLQTGRVLAGLYSMANVEFPRLLYSHWPLRLRGGCHRQFQSGRLPGALARPCLVALRDPWGVHQLGSS